MKQAASRIKRKNKQAYKKLGLTHNEVEQAADLTTQYLKSWTNKEIKRLALQENVPVCLPVGDHGFLVGTHKIEKLGTSCWRVLDHNDILIHDFSRKLSAVFYCFTTQSKKINLADRILNADIKVGKLESDQRFYQNTRLQSTKKKDYFRLDLSTSRSLDTEIRLKYAIEELEKTINIAKYLQV